MAELYFYDRDQLPSQGHIIEVDMKVVEELGELVDAHSVEDSHGHEAAPCVLIDMELEELLDTLDTDEDTTAVLLCCDFFSTTIQVSEEYV